MAPSLNKSVYCMYCCKSKRNYFPFIVSTLLKNRKQMYVYVYGWLIIFNYFHCLSDFWRKKTLKVVQNWFRTPIPTVHIKILFFNWAQGLRKFDCYPEMDKHCMKSDFVLTKTVQTNTAKLHLFWLSNTAWSQTPY